jgi:hypothetical protein
LPPKQPGHGPGEEHELLVRRVERLEREIAELRDANEILQSVALFLACRDDTTRRDHTEQPEQ